MNFNFNLIIILPEYLKTLTQSETSISLNMTNKFLIILMITYFELEYSIDSFFFFLIMIMDHY
jgi:hypothetical protein